MQRLHHFHDGGVRAMVHEVGVSLRGVRPVPHVREGVELRLARRAGRLAEEDVVIRIGIERRVEIHEVNARVGKNLRVPQPFQIVAEKKFVHLEKLHLIFIFWFRRPKNAEYQKTSRMNLLIADEQITVPTFSPKFINPFLPHFDFQRFFAGFALF